MEAKTPETPENPENSHSEIHVHFQEPGSAIISLQMTNITPIQMLAAAEFLRWQGLSNLDAQALQQMAAERPGSGIVTARSMPGRPGRH